MSEYIEHDQIGSSVGVVEKQSFTFAQKPDAMVLESGAALSPVTIAYETYGTLDNSGTNAVLICHALSGDSHVAGYYHPEEEKPGWWDFMVGPGKGIDTEKYFVICSNILGSCRGSTGPCSYNPATIEPFGIDFPLVTIGDMVDAQKKLLDYLNVKKLTAVVGGSIGGMQVLEWAVRYPEIVAAAIPLATTTRHSALAIAFNEVARQAIMADPNWNKGRYYAGQIPKMGLMVARMIGHITYLSDEAMRQKFGRRLQGKEKFSYNLDTDFQVESYLRYQGEKFVERFDANAILFITKAADYFDLKKQHGDGSLVKAFSKTRSRFLVVSFTSDWLYPTYQSREMVKAMKKNSLDVSFCEINADCGHDAFLIPNQKLTTIIKGFINRAYSEIK